MKNLLKSLYFFASALLLFTLLNACSESTNSSNNQSTNTENSITNTNDTSKKENLNAAGIAKTDCNRPLDIYLANDIFQTPGNYQLAYNWRAAENATSYEFEFLINGTPVLQNLNVTDTTITFTQAMTALDTIYARVKTKCGTETSTTAIQSAEVIYKNSIATVDVVFLASPNSNLDDICARSNCERLKFTGTSIKNHDGTVIPLDLASTRVYFDFDTVKDCIECKSGSAPVVNPATFNNCLRSPLNKYSLYDPNAYQVCP